MSKKQAINDKSPGSAATYLRCVWVVNNQIKKGLLLILLVEEFFQIGESYEQERVYLVHFLFLVAVWWSDAQNARDNQVFAMDETATSSA